MKGLYIALSLCLPMCLCAQRADSDHKLQRQIELFADVYRQLDMFYVDTLSADTAVRWAIDGMLRQVDPFTAYYPGDDNDELTQMTTGKYAGIGSVIRYHNGHQRAMIAEPYPGTPSEKAGLQAGDVLIAIDGRDVKGMPTSKVTTQLRGEAGTTFNLTLLRDADTLTVSITRRNIQMPTINYSGIVDDGIGYLDLTGFTEGSAGEVRRTVMKLMDDGCKSIVFDLRDNPGGSLEEAIDIVSLFVPKGTLVVSTKGKMQSTCREMRTRTQPIVPADMPVVVMVNGGSASAAEIVSGSLQDLDRAVVVGRRTYGKGLVQSIHDAPGGGCLKITTSRYHIPSGRCIQAYDYRHLNPDGSVGVVPDSLTHVFHTANGREVRDGGGLKPDVEVVNDTLPSMLFDLVASDQMFDFVTAFEKTHPTIAPAGEFVVDDSLYSAFVGYVAAHDFKYNRRTTEALAKLRELARIEGYDELAKAEFDALEKRLNPELESDLMRFRKEVSVYLADEIMTRYYHQAGLTRQMLVDNPYFNAAKTVLRDGSYSRILGQ